jgi:hypothetical protein
VIRNSATQILLLIFHCSSPTTLSAETAYNTMSAYSAFENIQGIVHKTSLQYNTTTPAEMCKLTGHHMVTAVPPCYTMLAHMVNNGDTSAHGLQDLFLA